MNDAIKTLLEQLGTGTLYMLGASGLVYDNTNDRLTFRVKGSPKANCIRIALDRVTDTYTVEFLKIRGLTCKAVADFSLVYADQLHKLIESQTGLYTRL